VIYELNIRKSRLLLLDLIKSLKGEATKKELLNLCLKHNIVKSEKELEILLMILEVENFIEIRTQKDDWVVILKEKSSEY